MVTGSKDMLRFGYSNSQKGLYAGIRNSKELNPCFIYIFPVSNKGYFDKVVKGFVFLDRKTGKAYKSHQKGERSHK